MTRKCINCGLESEGPFDVLKHCPVCGDNTEEMVVEKPKEKPKKETKKPDISDLDLNKDGKVDDKDRSIAGRVLASGRRKKKRRKR